MASLTPMGSRGPIPQMTEEELSQFDIEANLGLANIEEDQGEVDPAFNLHMEVDKTATSFQNVKSKTPPISPEKAPTRLRLGVQLPGRKAPLGHIVRKKLFLDTAAPNFKELYKRDVRKSLTGKRGASEAYNERGEAYLRQAREASQLRADFSSAVQSALSNDGREKVAKGERPNSYIPLSDSQ